MPGAREQARARAICSASGAGTSRRATLRVLIAGAVWGGAEAAGAGIRLADTDAGRETTTTTSGLRYYDFTAGALDGVEAGVGSFVRLRYTLGSTGARNGWRIADGEVGFVVGKGEVVKGLEEAVIGMRVEGRRRALVPAAIGYHGAKDRPVPKGFAEYQRFKNIYLNTERPYVPDVVFDIELLRVR